jgi:hypothetical protein
LKDKLYTIHKQQAGFRLSLNGDGLTQPETIADDIYSIYTILKPKLLPLKTTDKLNPIDAKNFYYLMKTRTGQKIASILMAKWRPGVVSSSSSTSSLSPTSPSIN